MSMKILSQLSSSELKASRLAYLCFFLDELEHIQDDWPVESIIVFLLSSTAIAQGHLFVKCLVVSDKWHKWKDKDLVTPL